MNDHNPKVYLLPNLMTAGNLFCGFAATLKIVQGALLQTSDPDSGPRSFMQPFGLSSAPAFLITRRTPRTPRRSGQHVWARIRLVSDIVSFGVAPALMVYRVPCSSIFRASVGSWPSSICFAERCVLLVLIPYPKATRQQTRKNSQAFRFPPPRD